MDEPEANLSQWTADSIAKWEAWKHYRRFPSSRGLCILSYGLLPTRNVVHADLQRVLAQMPPAPKRWWTPFFQGSSGPGWDRDVLEEWITPETTPELHERAEFWRVSSDGRAFLLRASREDLTDPEHQGSSFSTILPVYWLGGLLAHGVRLGRILGFSSIIFSGTWKGLFGRYLSDSDGHYVAVQDSVLIEPTHVRIEDVAASLTDHVAVALQPLYDSFEAQGGAAQLPLGPSFFDVQLADWQEWLKG